jgi:hypothetical protein
MRQAEEEERLDKLQEEKRQAAIVAERNRQVKEFTTNDSSIESASISREAKTRIANALQGKKVTGVKTKPIPTPTSNQYIDDILVRILGLRYGWHHEALKLAYDKQYPPDEVPLVPFDLSDLHEVRPEEEVGPTPHKYMSLETQARLLKSGLSADTIDQIRDIFMDASGPEERARLVERYLFKSRFPKTLPTIDNGAAGKITSVRIEVPPHLLKYQLWYILLFVIQKVLLAQEIKPLVDWVIHQEAEDEGRNPRMQNIVEYYELQERGANRIQFYFRWSTPALFLQHYGIPPARLRTIEPPVYQYNQ